MEGKKSMSFGKRLRALRLEKRINQKELAARARIDVTYLSKVETGKMEPPAEDTVKRLAEALDQEPTELLILAKKVPADVREIITTSPAVSHFLRTTHQQQWGPEQWRRLQRRVETDQQSLFDDADDEPATRTDD